MDWKLFFVTFGSIFLAEFADKTQLATMTFSASTGRPWVVFAASALALVLVTAVGSFGGAFAAKYVPKVWLHRVAALLFIGVGIFILVSGLRKESV